MATNIRDKTRSVFDWWRSPQGMLVAKRLQVLMTIGIVTYLAVRLTSIGWISIVESLPTSPLFYLLFALLYVSLPLAEVLVYRAAWGPMPFRKTFGALIKKRVYNRDLLGYSGEVYLYMWARNVVRKTERELLETVRDTNIVSSVASTAVAVCLLTVFLYLGHFNVRGWFSHQPIHYVLIGAAIAAVLIALGWRFRRYIFSMAPRIAAIVLGIYAVRLILGQVLQIGQWSVAMPSVALSTWFTFAAVSLIVSRIPFIPSQDLVFLGASVELSTMMDIPTAGVAGMLLAISVLDKVTNLSLFAGISIYERRSARKPDDDSLGVAKGGSEDVRSFHDGSAPTGQA